jgi:intraflagellar transport protein 172
VLYKTVAALRKGADPSATPANIAELESALLLVHYASSRARYASLGLQELVARLSMAMLRFAGTGQGLPAERGYYEAGAACKEVGMRSHAFVLFNRFLDIANAIDDGGDLSGLDNVDFVGTGLPSPDQFVAETAHYVAEPQVRPCPASCVALPYSCSV